VRRATPEQFKEAFFGFLENYQDTLSPQRIRVRAVDRGQWEVEEPVSVPEEKSSEGEG